MADLEQLFEELHKAKAAEAEAKAARLSVEEQILSQIENAPEVGSLTLKGGSYRCSVKFARSYKADVEAIRQLEVEPDLLPLRLKPATYELDKKAYEDLRGKRPDVFAKVAACVASKASKPSLTLKV